MAIKNKLNKKIIKVQDAAKNTIDDANGLISDLRKKINNLNVPLPEFVEDYLTKLEETLDCETVNDNVDDFHSFVSGMQVHELLKEVEDDPEEIMLIMKDQMIKLPDNYVLIKMNDITAETEIKKQLDNEEFLGRIEIVI